MRRDCLDLDTIDRLLYRPELFRELDIDIRSAKQVDLGMHASVFRLGDGRIMRVSSDIIEYFDAVYFNRLIPYGLSVPHNDVLEIVYSGREFSFISVRDDVADVPNDRNIERIINHFSILRNVCECVKHNNTDVLLSLNTDGIDIGSRQREVAEASIEFLLRADQRMVRCFADLFVAYHQLTGFVYADGAVSNIGVSGDRYVIRDPYTQSSVLDMIGDDNLTKFRGTVRHSFLSQGTINSMHREIPEFTAMFTDIHQKIETLASTRIPTSVAAFRR